MVIALKLTRNGNATTITIPRRVLRFMRWNAGDAMILEVSSCDSVEVRRPRASDFNVSGHLRVIEGSLPEVTK